MNPSFRFFPKPDGTVALRRVDDVRGILTRFDVAGAKQLREQLDQAIREQEAKG